jgi:hypothetical protein
MYITTEQRARVCLGCMCVYTERKKERQIDGWVDGWVDGWMDGWTDR